MHSPLASAAPENVNFTYSQVTLLSGVFDAPLAAPMADCLFWAAGGGDSSSIIFNRVEASGRRRPLLLVSGHATRSA